MNIPTRQTSQVRTAWLASASFALAFAAAMHPAGAQIAERPAVTAQTPAQRHADGLAMEHRKDDGGAFIAFTEAAERGHPPAQRKLGEIYDHGNPAVPRDYEQSLKWYEKARESGEDIPPVRSRMPGLDLGP